MALDSDADIIDPLVLDAAVDAFKGRPDTVVAMSNVSEAYLRERMELALQAVRNPRLGPKRFVTVSEVRTWMREVSDSLNW